MLASDAGSHKKDGNQLKTDRHALPAGELLQRAGHTSSSEGGFIAGQVKIMQLCTELPSCKMKQLSEYCMAAKAGVDINI